MDKATRKKKYLIAIIIQLVLIIGYAVANFFVLKIEQVVLEPVKYILPGAIAIALIDGIVLLFVFKNKNNNSGDIESADYYISGHSDVENSNYYITGERDSNNINNNNNMNTDNEVVEVSHE